MMQQQYRIAIVGLAVLALAACNGNGASLPVPRQVIQSTAHTSDVTLNNVHLMRTRYSAAPMSDAPKTLQYNGGPIQRTPSVYVVFWGFNVSGSDPSGEQAYVTSFLNGVGHSAWLNTDHQYYQIVGGIMQKIKNPAGQLKGTWVDSSMVPASPSVVQVQTEARIAEAHFGFHKHASYVVATPHGHNTPGFGSSFCAYHSTASTPGGLISFTNLPYMTDQGGNCGANAVNPGPGGVLDGVSIVEGHELAESQTDPQPVSGWNNNTFGEIGDICAWQDLGDTTLTTGTFAVQPLWSNSTSAFVLHSP